jgi:hypothetical protein
MNDPEDDMNKIAEAGAKYTLIFWLLVGVIMAIAVYVG